jgi:hypothetical protein
VEDPVEAGNKSRGSCLLYSSPSPQFFTQLAFPDSKFASPSKKLVSRSMSIKIPIYTNITPPSSENKKYSVESKSKGKLCNRTFKIPIKLLSTPRLFPPRSPHPEAKI